MASKNPFDLLGEDDNADPSDFLSKIAASAAAAKDKDKHQPKKQQPKFPTKPVPPAQAVREAKEGGRGRGGNYGRGGRVGRGSEYGRGRGGNYSEEGNFSNDGPYESNAAYRTSRQEDGDTVSGDRGRGRGRGRGGRGYGGRGGFGGESEENRRRPFDRHSSSGRSGEMKREGAGRGNWGTPSDEVILPERDEVAAEEEKIPTEAKPENEGTKEFSEEKKEEEEDKEMTLDEYEKLQEEKRKGLMASRAEERKVDPKEFESLKPLNKKKSEDELFMKVGSEKDKQKKADVEKVKKAMNITEFLKPSDGGGYSRGGRGRGRGRGDRGGFRGGYAGGGNAYQPEAPSIEDTSQFPTLGGK